MMSGQGWHLLCSQLQISELTQVLHDSICCDNWLVDLTPRCDTQLSAPTLGHSNQVLELTVVGGAAKIMVHKPVVATDGIMRVLG